MRSFKYHYESFRLEPNHDYAIEEGVQARVKDPLGMLGRQWTVGEFLASDGGRPVRFEASYHHRPIDEIRIGNDPDREFSTIENMGVPLEKLVEAEGADGSAPGWNAEHLEYNFAVRGGDYLLEGREYNGDHLDWYSLDLTNEGDFTQPPEKVSMRPSPVRYHGQADPAWYTIENMDVNLGNLARPHLNYLTMLLVEFALIYSEDWFMIPMDLPVGHIRRIDSVLVVDTFGVVTEATPIGSSQGCSLDLFTLARPGGQPTDGRVFYMPNNLWQALESEPQEQVSFLRDEMANLVWAVEHCYQGEDGQCVYRHDEAVTEGSEGAQIPTPSHYFDREIKQLIERPETFAEGEPGKRYRGPVALYLEQAIPPEYWVPYVQRYLEQGVVLRRARTNLDPNHKQYHGKVLSESKLIAEAEVPRAGISVTRLYQVARNTQGELVFWLGRKKQPGKPQKGSGLRLDALIEQKGGSP